MKKRIALFMTLVLVLSLGLAAPGHAEEGFTIKGGVLIGYDGPGGNVVIPEGVTSIGEEAFAGRSGLTGVTIPEGVTSIGDRAFFCCGNLTDLTIPESVTIIGESAFSGCNSLESVTIPMGVTQIAGGTFKSCKGLNTVTIPWGVTSIGEEAFAGCSSLTDVRIPNSVTNIGERSFWNCSGLMNVTIPSSVTSISKRSFWNCSGLTRVTIQNGVTSIGDEAFTLCSSLTSVIVPKSVTSIGIMIFHGCDVLTDIYYEGSEAQWEQISIGEYNAQLTKASIHYNSTLANEDFTIHDGVLVKYNGPGGDVVIPAEVTCIGNYAFELCGGLTSVTIPESVTNIGESAFFACSNLTSVTIPEGVTRIGDNTFAACFCLTSVTIPESVTSIGNSAFQGCKSLTSIMIPEGVMSIGDYAFNNCDGLTSVTIPESVTSIGDYAFHWCDGLTIVTVPSGVTSLTGSAFAECRNLLSISVDPGNPCFRSEDGVLFNKTGTKLVAYPGGKTGAYAIPAGVAYIGDYAFAACDGLMSVTIPESVTSIGDCAFTACGGLMSVTIPAGVTSLAGSAFAECSNLLSISVDPGNPCFRSEDGVLFNKTGTELLTFPAARTGAYAIPAGVTSIGDYAFADCFHMTSVTIPAGVTSIGVLAFADCDGLTDVYYEGSEAQWEQISIMEDNDQLAEAAIHYNSAGPAAEAPGSGGITRQTIPDSGTAATSTQTVTVGTGRIAFPAYALLNEQGNPTNYVRLRDLAQLLNGTAAQFDVTWSRETGICLVSGSAYDHPNGTEGNIPFTGDQPYRAYLEDTLVDGVPVSLTAFRITWEEADHTFYQLRDLGKALNFNVGWSRDRGIYIEPDKPYSDAD